MALETTTRREAHPHRVSGRSGRSRRKLLDRPLYSADVDIAVAYEDVQHLLPLEPHKKAELSAKYMQRINASPQGRKIGVLVADFNGVRDGEIQELGRRGVAAAYAQVDYINQISRNKLEAYTFNDLREALHQGKQVAIIPYVNNLALQQELSAQKLLRSGLEIRAIDSKVVDVLINKVSLHKKLREIGNPDLAVPHHENTVVSKVAEASAAMLAFENELYQATGLKDYRRGVVARLEDSEGGFGSGRVVQDKNGDVRFINDENEKNPPSFGKDWDRAFQALQNYLLEKNGNKPDAKVVVSRFLDLKSSPGNSMFFMDGEVFSLGPNGQHLDKQSGRCIGTYTLGRRRPAYSNRLVSAVKGLVFAVAREQDVSPNSLRGPLGVDLMLHGKKEMALQRAIVAGMRKGTLNDKLLAQLKQYGQLNKEIRWSIAEFNARTTNYSGAIFNVMLSLGLPNTPRSINTVIKNRLNNLDYYPVPKGLNIKALREELSRNRKMFLRMVPVNKPNPDFVGMIFTGYMWKRRLELHGVFRKAKRRGRKETHVS